MAQTVKQFTQSDSHLLTIKEAADFLRISRRSLFYLISKGRLQAVRLSPRMTRISLHELQQLTESAFVASASSFPPFNNDNREKKKPDVPAKPETGNVNKKAKCRITPASDIAPEGVTHKTHYTMAEVMRYVTAISWHPSMPGVRLPSEKRMSRRLLPSITRNRARHSRRHTTPASTSCRNTVWARRKYAALPRHTVSASRKPRVAGLTSTSKRTGKQPERKPRR